MQRLPPAETKLVLCVYNDFTLWRPPAELAESIRRRWPEMKVVHLPTYDRLAEEIADTHIHVGYALRPAQFRQARNLRWIHVTAAGVSQMMFPEFVASDVVLTNARGVNAIPIGDHTIGMMIALARHFPSAWRHQAARRWAQQQIWDENPRPRELAGQRLLLVGLGSIGREIAVRARGFAMKITAVTRSGRDRDGLADEILPADRLDSALVEADFVVLAAPETTATRQLLDARRLALMKPSAFLINVSRGTLVHEAALEEALRSRRIAGAAIDVAAEEPLPPESPLWSLDNIIITPHLANATESLWQRQAAILMETLDRWFSGRDLINVVDKQRGY
ncbi:MAG TPA: D-2-hydroxyacid dehydrogenase [Candidatus Acidoferrales bacterium]|nr:D-2-hydroxyacid dehydrogenase [Candidatus Acidoferrales bacterium]